MKHTSKYISFTFILTLYFLIAFNAHSMELSNNRVGSLKVSGKIVKGDSDKILTHLLNANINSTPYIFIESPGGDVMEAIKIGNLLHNIRATVFAENKCNSSCFFILAGAVKRIAGVNIGLHRPYYDKSYFSSLSSKKAEEKYQLMNKKVKQYLLEKEIPINIIETMMNTPSSQITYLSTSDYDKMIGETSSAYAEWLHSKCGSLSTKEISDYNKVNLINTFPNPVPEFIPQQDKDYFLNNINYVSSLSTGYKDYLKEKYNKINDCVYKEKISEWKSYKEKHNK